MKSTITINKPTEISCVLPDCTMTFAVPRTGINPRCSVCTYRVYPADLACIPSMNRNTSHLNIGHSHIWAHKSCVDEGMREYYITKLQT